MEELKLIHIKDIQKNPYQPRKEFSKEKIQELAQSIVDEEKNRLAASISDSPKHLN